MFKAAARPALSGASVQHAGVKGAGKYMSPSLPVILSQERTHKLAFSSLLRRRSSIF